MHGSIGAAVLAQRLLLREMRHFEMASAQIGDAGAVAALLLPEAVETRRMHVTVELAGQKTRGMTVCDQRAFVSPPDAPKGEENVDVVVNVDAERLKKLFADYLLNPWAAAEP